MSRLPTILGSRIEAEKAAMVAELREVLGLPDGAGWATCLEMVRARRYEGMWNGIPVKTVPGMEPGEVDLIVSWDPGVDVSDMLAYFPMRELDDEQD